MVYGFKLVREAVSQGLLMSWAVLVFRIHPALTMGAVRPTSIGRMSPASFLSRMTTNGSSRMESGQFCCYPLWMHMGQSLHVLCP